jgi:hypothetical protein
MKPREGKNDSSHTERSNRARCRVSRPAFDGHLDCLSFFSTLKNEQTLHDRYHTRAQARAAIFEFIELFYDPVVSTRI